MPAKVISIIFLLSLLVGCQTTRFQPASASLYLHDDLFPNHHSVTIETIDEVFAINEDMQAFVDNHVKAKESQKAQIKTLAKGIFEHSDISLLYQNDANTVATETFANRAANCLSLTIMTYALADYAGFGVDFQQVDIPELWVRRDGASMLNRHINLKLFEKKKGMVIVITKHDYTVDFNQIAGNRYFPRRVIGKERVLSMFYNNKGVDALLANDSNTAYAYFKQGILADPSLVDNYTNLGLLYRRMGRNDLAEANYEIALKISPDDGTTLENLAALYRMTSRSAEADRIHRELRNKRKNNPYYHYLLGEEAIEKHDLILAKRHFRQAIDLQQKNHEFYFAMAKTLYLLGEKKSSKHYMKLAKKYSDSKSEELRYQYKLNSISQLDK